MVLVTEVVVLDVGVVVGVVEVVVLVGVDVNVEGKRILWKL